MFPMSSERYGPLGPAAPETVPPKTPEGLTSELTRRFWTRLRFFAARRLGDAGLAEDVAQETLRRVFQALQDGRVANQVALPGFVFQTARNICMHEQRSFGRAARAFSLLSSSGDGNLSSEADPLAALLSEERRAQVRRALEALGVEDRALLSSLYAEGVEAAEAARVLGISTAALRVRKHRALKRLAEALARQKAETPGQLREPNR